MARRTKTRQTKGHTAVQARRAPEIVEADDPQRAQWRALDYYPTPPWAARALAHFLKQIDSHANSVWEPCCGAGHMAVPLAEYFPIVHASDIFDHGFGEVRDFFTDAPMPECDWIVTNPPFKRGEDFVRRAWPIARKGVAVICRLAFLEGGERHAIFDGDAFQPLSFCCPFSERVPMQLGSWDPELSSATAYAAFIWLKNLNHIPLRFHFFGPGTRERYWRDTDAARFSPLAPLPLFD